MGKPNKDWGNIILTGAGTFFAIVGFVVFGFAVQWLSDGYKQKINFTGLSLFGSYVSGVVGASFSLSTVLFVLATYLSQRKQIKLQEDELQKQESRYIAQLTENKQAGIEAERRHRELLQAQIDENKQAESRHKEQLQRQKEEFEAREKQAKEQLEAQREESKNQLAVFQKQDFDNKIKTYISMANEFIMSYNFNQDAYKGLGKQSLITINNNLQTIIINSYYWHTGVKNIFIEINNRKYSFPDRVLIKIHETDIRSISLLIKADIDCQAPLISNYFNMLKNIIQIAYEIDLHYEAEGSPYQGDYINLLRVVLIEEELLVFFYYFGNNEPVQTLLRDSGLLAHIPAARFKNPAHKPKNAAVA